MQVGEFPEATEHRMTCLETAIESVKGAPAIHGTNGLVTGQACGGFGSEGGPFVELLQGAPERWAADCEQRCAAVWRLRKCLQAAIQPDSPGQGRACFRDAGRVCPSARSAYFRAGEPEQKAVIWGGAYPLLVMGWVAVAGDRRRRYLAFPVHHLVAALSFGGPTLLQSRTRPTEKHPMGRVLPASCLHAVLCSGSACFRPACVRFGSQAANREDWMDRAFLQKAASRAEPVMLLRPATQQARDARGRRKGQRKQQRRARLCLRPRYKR